jgi:hypothetical protein
VATADSSCNTNEAPAKAEAATAAEGDRAILG